jgi:hypothetical protein
MIIKVKYCCLVGVLDYIYIPHYTNHDKKGTGSAAGKMGQDIK